MQYYDIDLALDPYLRWQEVGRKESATIKALLRAFKLTPAVVARGWPLLQVLHRRDIELYQELEGLAAAAKVDLAVLAAANLMYDLSFLVEHLPIFGCSSVAVKRGGVFTHFRALDWAESRRLSAATRLITYHTPHGEVVTAGFPGMLGVLTFASAAGFVGSLNRAPDAKLNLGGRPALLHMRSVALASSFAEAQALAHTPSLTASFIHLTSPKQSLVCHAGTERQAVGGVLIQTNHVAGVGDEESGGYPASGERYLAGEDFAMLGAPTLTAFQRSAMCHDSTVYCVELTPSGASGLRLACQ